MVSNNKKRILIVLYHDYHLFGYFQYLVPLLLEAGYKVTLLTCDVDIRDRYAPYSDHPSFNLTYKRYLRILMRLMDFTILRPFVWMIGWVWSFLAVKGFDAVILPRDSKPFQHMIGCWRPTLVCQPGLATDDKHYLRHRYTGDVPFPVPEVRSKRQSYRRVDEIFGGSYLKSVRGCLNKKYYSVIGSDFKDFYCALGIPFDHIYVTGNPNYENLLLDDSDLDELCFHLAVDQDKPVYTFFASQLFFSDVELSCLRDVAVAIAERDVSSLFLIKIHPRMTHQNISLLQNWASSIDVLDIRLVTDLSGDQNNMKLIRLSSAVLIEESNVGILSAWLRKPLLVLNISGKDLRNIYTLYDGVLDITDAGNVQAALNQVYDPVACDRVLDAQDEMVRRISKRLESPNKKIVEILDDMLNTTIDKKEV